MGQHTFAERVANLGDSGRIDFSAAGFIGAVADAVSEVDVPTKTCQIVVSAAKLAGKTQHVGDAYFLYERQSKGGVGVAMHVRRSLAGR